jgi:exonuclease III
VKNTKLNKGEHCGQHSGDVAVLAWQDKKRETVISTYHKDDMRVVVNKANRVQSKSAVVCDYNVNMLEVDLKDQMLQLYLLQWKKSTKWYLKLFKRLLSVAIHNTVVISWYLPNNKKIGRAHV